MVSFLAEVLFEDEPLPDEPLPDEPLPDEPLPDAPLLDEPLPVAEVSPEPFAAALDAPLLEPFAPLRLSVR
ncbi:MAG TPA: hypothetical protein VFZ85_16450 [Jiangellaceae bacterium]